jgi:DNA-binding XRE family transcriptional regulator
LTVEPQAKAKRKPDNGLPESNIILTKGIDKLSLWLYDLGIAMTKRTYPNIAARIKATGETQAELAELLGVSQPFMSKIIRGIQQPSLDEALRIADKLRVPVESLVARTNADELTLGK